MIFCVEDFKVGDYVNLVGNIQSFRREGKTSHIVFVESIVPTEYTDKGHYNQFWLSGTVADICELRNCLRITVKSENKGRVSFVPVVYYYPDVRRLNFEVGEKISTQGSIQSIRKPDGEGGYIFFQNYVGSQYQTT